MDASSRPARFPKSARLQKRAEFLLAQNRGHKLHLSHFLVFAIRAECAEREGARLGITITKKVGHAVFRNRIKRWVREAFRRERHRFPSGWDLVFVAKRQCVNADYAAVLRDMRSAGRQVSRRCASVKATEPQAPSAT